VTFGVRPELDETATATATPRARFNYVEVEVLPATRAAPRQQGLKPAAGGARTDYVEVNIDATTAIARIVESTPSDQHPSLPAARQIDQMRNHVAQVVEAFAQSHRLAVVAKLRQGGDYGSAVACRELERQLHGKAFEALADEMWDDLCKRNPRVSIGPLLTLYSAVVAQQTAFAFHRLDAAHKEIFARHATRGAAHLQSLFQRSLDEAIITRGAVLARTEILSEMSRRGAGSPDPGASSHAIIP
jgi:hypothetical protein